MMPVTLRLLLRCPVHMGKDPLTLQRKWTARLQSTTEHVACFCFCRGLGPDKRFHLLHDSPVTPSFTQETRVAIAVDDVAGWSQ